MNRIRELCEREGLSVEGLASRLSPILGGITRATVYRWAAGTSYPRPKALAALCEAFHVSEVELKLSLPVKKVSSPKPMAGSEESFFRTIGAKEEDVALILNNSITHQPIAETIARVCNKLRAALK